MTISRVGKMFIFRVFCWELSPKNHYSSTSDGVCACVCQLIRKGKPVFQDWFKKDTNKTNHDTQSHTCTCFPALCVSYIYILWVLTGALDCLCPLRLVKMMMQVSDLRHSIENALNPDLLTDLDYNSEQTVLKLITIKTYRFVCKLFPQTQ